MKINEETLVKWFGIAEKVIFGGISALIIYVIMYCNYFFLRFILGVY